MVGPPPGLDGYSAIDRPVLEVSAAQDHLVAPVLGVCQVIAERSGHNIQLDQPQLGVREIRQAVEEARSAIVSFERIDDHDAAVIGSALAGEVLELLGVPLGLVLTGKLLQIFADHLVQALVHRLRHPARLGDGLLVDGQGDVHGRAQILRT